MIARFVAVRVISVVPWHICCSSLSILGLSHVCQVTAKIGYPITGYGTESRNRAARQRIQNRVWTDEDGVEHVEVA